MENQMTFTPFAKAKRWMAMLGAIFAMGTVTSADAGLFGLGGTSWKEEVLLHDGSTILVDRSVVRGGRHEIGQQPPFKEQSLSFSLPGTNRTVTWEDRCSEDLGSANFLPMLLDIVNGMSFIVTTPMGCLAYNKWGRPNPPYVIFKHDGKEWKRIPLEELPAEIKVPNLIISDPDNEVKKMGKNLVTANEIRDVIKGYRIPEDRTILRELVMSGEGSLINCEKLVSYKGAWVGPGDSIGKRMRDLETK